MAFTNFWRTFVAIGATVAFFSAITVVFCCIYHREKRRGIGSDTASETLPNSSAPFGINLTEWASIRDLGGSDETLVPVSSK